MTTNGLRMNCVWRLPTDYEWTVSDDCQRTVNELCVMNVDDCEWTVSNDCQWTSMTVYLWTVIIGTFHSQSVDSKVQSRTNNCIGDDCQGCERTTDCEWTVCEMTVMDCKRTTICRWSSADCQRAVRPVVDADWQRTSSMALLIVIPVNAAGLRYHILYHTQAANANCCEWTVNKLDDERTNLWTTVITWSFAHLRLSAIVTRVV